MGKLRVLSGRELCKILGANGFVFAAAFLLLALPALARNYYVDSQAGRDDAPATRAAPWKTLANVNATVFAPGDYILLKSGEVWPGPLSPKGSGDAAHPIILDRYGAGPLPLVRSDNDTAPLSLAGQQYWILQNLAISGGSRGVDETAVFVGSADGATVSGCRMEKGSAEPIVVRHSTNVVVQNNALLLPNMVLEPNPAPEKEPA